MKRFLILLSLLFCHTVYADTINLHWLNEDGSVYQNSTCTVDGDLNIPSTPPTKYGYTFTGWKMANYIPIEYLESTGTQYIDTEYIPTNLTNIFKSEIDLAYLSVRTLDNRNPFVLGVQENSDFLRTGLLQGKFFFTLSKSGTGYDYPISATPTLGSKYNVTVEYNKGDSARLIVKTNGGTVGISTQTGNITFPYRSVYLFASNSAAISIDGLRNIIGRVYSCKIYDNDTLVRDFIPVLDNNGTPCMYDKVTQQFFYNAGTGQFIAGPAL